jgi:hypothetical protein
VAVNIFDMASHSIWEFLTAGQSVLLSGDESENGGGRDQNL